MLPLWFPVTQIFNHKSLNYSNVLIDQKQLRILCLCYVLLLSYQVILLKAFIRKDVAIHRIIINTILEYSIFESTHSSKYTCSIHNAIFRFPCVQSRLI